MKFRALAIGLLLTAASCFAADVDGKWTGTMNTPNGDVPVSFTFKADGAKVAAGKAKSDEVLCPMCHLGGFVGQNEIPRVAGQHYKYVKKQLEDFKARRRTNDAGNMTSVASTLSDQDIENLSQYIANL